MKSYHALLRDILENGDEHHDRTGVGTLSVFGRQFVHKMGTGFPLLTTKKMFLRGVVEELRWFLQGRTDNQWLNERNVHIWDAWSSAEQCAKFGREPGDLGPIYGKQWRNFGAMEIPLSEIVVKPEEGVFQQTTTVKVKGVDQIKNLVTDLQKTPNSRRLIVTGWNPMEANRVALPPCHTLFQCKVTEKDVHTGDWDAVSSTNYVQYLDLQLYQRSADSFLGVPFNIASYALLLQLLAHVTNMQARNFIHTFGDLHIYKNHMEQVKEQLSREPKQLPLLTLNPRLKGGGFDALLDFKWEDVTLHDYEFWPALKGEVAV